MLSFRGSTLFSLVVLVALLLFGVIGVMVLLMQLQPGFMGMAHGTQPHHRVHDLTFGLVLAPGAVGLLAQLRAPSRNVAGQMMSLVPWVALLLAFVLSGTRLVFAPAPLLGALTLIATLLHPGTRAFVHAFTMSRINVVLVALVAIAAVPLLTLASTAISLQRTLTNDHAALGHYGFMAAFSFTVIGIGLVASFRPSGWKLAARVGGLLPALLASASLVYPGNDSSLGKVWAVAAIGWSVVFIAAAQVGAARTAHDPLYQDGAHSGAPAGRESAPSGPGFMTTAGIVAIVVILLFTMMHVAGGGFARHGR